jgi:hypothetical protein
MIIKKAQVYEPSGFTDAILEIRVDEVPRDLVYIEKQINSQFAYFTKQDGFVSFYIYDPNDETGSGEQTFVLPILVNPETREIIKKHLKGLFISTPGLMNIIFSDREDQSMNCILFEGENHIGIPGRITIRKAYYILTTFQLIRDWGLEKFEDKNEEGILIDRSYRLVKK